MKIRSNEDLRGNVAYITALLNNICNSTSSDEIKKDFDKIKQAATELTNYKLRLIEGQKSDGN